MSNITNDPKIDWYDPTRDHVIKKGNNRLWEVNKQKNKFNWENMDIQYDDEYDDEEIGISKQSWRVADNDEPFEYWQEKVNRGRRGGRSWRDDLPFDLKLELALDDDDDDDWYDDDEF